METKVINPNVPLPRVKITSGKTCIVCKHDTIFGDYCAYQFDPIETDLITNLIDCLTKILEENA